MITYIKRLFDDPEAGADNGSDNGSDNGQKAEQKTEQGEKLYTKAEMDAYTNNVVKQKKAEWDKKHTEKLSSEAARLADMDATQRLEHERDDWKSKYEALYATNERNALKTQAVSILAKAGISGLSDDLIDRLVGKDAEETKTSVDSFISAYNSAVKGGIKDAAKHPTPKSGSTKPTVTKESILAIKNDVERQAMMRKYHKLFGF